MAKVLYSGRGQYRVAKADRGFTKAQKKAERKANTWTKLLAAARKGLVVFRVNKLYVNQLVKSL